MSDSKELCQRGQGSFTREVEKQFHPAESGSADLVD
jgi:hypothetical protein